MKVSTARTAVKPDSGLLLAADRLTNGANGHKMRNLLNAYTLACENGDPAWITKTQHNLTDYMLQQLNITIIPVD